MMFTPTRKLFKPFNATLAALLLACAAPAWADIDAQFQQANAAYDAGNYKQAFRLLQPLAQQGDASSQNNLEPVFIICIGRFYGIKARIQGKKHSKVEHLARIFNAVAAFLGHKRCLWK